MHVDRWPGTNKGGGRYGGGKDITREEGKKRGRERRSEDWKEKARKRDVIEKERYIQGRTDARTLDSNK